MNQNFIKHFITLYIEKKYLIINIIRYIIITQFKKVKYKNESNSMF